MKSEEVKKLNKRLDKLEKHLMGGYDDKIPPNVYVNEYPSGDEDVRIVQAKAAKKYDGNMSKQIAAQVEREIEAATVNRQSEAFSNMVAISNDMKNKIREIADMPVMGDIRLGMGEAWYQGMGLDEDHLMCPHCKGGIKVRKMKKFLYRRKKHKNMAKGKPKPKKPRFMLLKKGKKINKKPGPKKGGKISEKRKEWMDYCHAVAKLPKMKGHAWNDVMKEASALKKLGITKTDIKNHKL